MTNTEAVQILRDSNKALKSTMPSESLLDVSHNSNLNHDPQEWRKFLESGFKNKYGYTMQEAQDKYDACELAIKALERELLREQPQEASNRLPVLRIHGLGRFEFIYGKTIRCRRIKRQAHGKSVAAVS